MIELIIVLLFGAVLGIVAHFEWAHR